MRQVTPKSLPSISTTASNVSSTFAGQHPQLSDAENISPSGRRAQGSFSFPSHEQTAVLQEIGIAALVGTLRAKRVRPRAASGKLFTPEGSRDTVGESLESPPPATKQHSRPNTARARVSKMSSRPRRSISAETRRYVDHLEEELNAAQLQLQAVNSPSVTREQSSNMRHMKAEVSRLRDEIEDWETQFDSRVREEVDKCYAVEQDLRAQLRALEEEVGESKYRIQELECQLSTTTEALDATEIANVNMEKRLEFFSDLLASSPTKLDLHAQTPGRPRHSRPPSILPRIPTANSLARSPDRHSMAHPTSPMQFRFGTGQPVSPSNAAYSPDMASSEEDTTQSGMSGFSGLHQSNVKRPARRMRRFGAGSMGPKPLILPSTTHCEPASAPPFGRGDYDYDASFPMSPDQLRMDQGSPVVHRRRASTKTNSSGSPVQLAGSPFPDFQALPDSDEMGNEDTVSTLRQHSPPFRGVNYSSEYDALLDSNFNEERSTARPQSIIRNFDSLGSSTGGAIGRNLMDELEAAQSCSSVSRPSHVFEASEDMGTNAYPISSPSASQPADDDSVGLQTTETTPDHTATRFPSMSSTAVATMPRQVLPPILQHNASSKTLGVQSIRSLSTLDSLREFFGDIAASPLNMAKYLIERAQARLQVPRPMLSIQWWLVGILLGPMAKRRYLAKRSCCNKDSEAEQHLLEDTPSRPSTADEGLEYGGLYQTPPPSSSTGGNTARSRGLVAGKGIKRASSKGIAKHCPHTQQRWKHSPLLWLKFSMTLAIAVGIAFKDGPSSLLKEALCNCKPTASANWRQTKRDAIASPNDD